MTARTRVLLMGLLGLAAVTIAAVTINKAISERAEARQHLARYTTLRIASEEILQLRAALPTTGEDHASAQSRPLASSAGEILAAAGLPAATLSSLSPESESTETADKAIALIRRRATLTLTPLTLPQLGRFLDAWRQRLPSWTIARIDIEPRRDSASTPGSDLPIRTVIAVESVRLAAPPLPPSPSSPSNARRR